jgi:hypothetical protein
MSEKKLPLRKGKWKKGKRGNTHWKAMDAEISRTVIPLSPFPFHTPPGSKACCPDPSIAGADSAKTSIAVS